MSSTNPSTDLSANQISDLSANSVKKESKYSKDNHLDNTTLILTASFLAIYFVVYAITGLFYDSSDPSNVLRKPPWLMSLFCY